MFVRGDVGTRGVAAVSSSPMTRRSECVTAAPTPSTETDDMNDRRSMATSDLTGETTDYGRERARCASEQLAGETVGCILAPPRRTLNIAFAARDETKRRVKIGRASCRERVESRGD